MSTRNIATTDAASAYDVIIIGAGAAGLMCAIEAGKRGRRVVVLDHAKKPAEKIRISGGGRCNFTNLHTTPQHFISNNPAFCVSALSRYTPRHFIALVEKHGIAYHEKTLGQLFCDGSSREIIDMLLAECRAVGAAIWLEHTVTTIVKTEDGFSLSANHKTLTCASLVIATGGPSIPKMGSSGFGYAVAKQFGLKVVPPRAALVPFTFEGERLDYVKHLAGVSLEVVAQCGTAHFREGMLFTHRGLSGPAMLQISSYWREGRAVTINLVPDADMVSVLKQHKQEHPKQELVTALARFLPRRLADQIVRDHNITVKAAEIADRTLKAVGESINGWKIVPDGTEGMRTAEVTLGGVDTAQISSKSMESMAIKGLYFIGEVVDVTGHLGGFNFQWAWASGFCAGQQA